MEHSQPNAQLSQISIARETHTVSIRRQDRQSRILKMRMRNINMSQPTHQDSETKPQPEDIQYFCQCLKDSQIDKVFYGLHEIRKLLRQPLEDKYIETILDQRVVNFMLQKARTSEDIKLQSGAISILSNICSGKSEHVAYLVSKGVLDLAVYLLKSGISQAQKDAIWLVGNIAGDDQKYRLPLINYGVLQQIYRIYSTSHDPQVRACCEWTTLNVIMLEQPPINLMIISLLMEILKSLLLAVNQKPAILTDLLSTLSKLSAKYKEVCLRLVKQRVIPALLHMMKTIDSSRTIIICLRIFGNITNNLSQQIDLLIEDNILQILQYVLDNSQYQVRKEVAWVLSNISAGTKSQSIALYNRTSLMNKLIHLFLNDTQKVQVQIGWIFSNFYINLEPAIMYALLKRTIQGFNNFINFNQDTNALRIGMMGVEYYLKLYEEFRDTNGSEQPIIQELVTKLFALSTSHSSEKIKSKAQIIINTHLISDDEQDHDQDEDQNDEEYI